MKKLLSLVDIPISILATYGIYLLTRGNIESIKNISTFIYLFIQIMFGIIMFKMARKQKLNVVDNFVYHQQKIARPLDGVADTKGAVEEIHKNIKRGGKIMDKIKLFFDKFGSLIVSGAAVVVGLLSYSGVLDSVVNIFFKDDLTRGKVVCGSVLVIAGAVVAYGGNSHTKVENANIKTVLGKEVVTKTPEQIQAEANKKIAIIELAKCTKELKSFDTKNSKRIAILNYKNTARTANDDEAKELSDLLGERAYLAHQVEVNAQFAE